MKIRERRTKKISLYNKIKSIPIDIYDYILDILYGLEIPNATKKWLSFILSIILHIISIYLRIKYIEVYEVGLKVNELEKYKKIIEVIPNSNYLIDNQENNLLISCLIILFLTSWNSLYFFNKYKTYSLFYTNALDNLVDNEGYFNSKNMRMKDIEEKNWINRIYGWLYKNKEENATFVELKMWDVDNLVFSANIFCYFSPAHLLTYCIVNDHHSLIIVLIINLLISLQIKVTLNHSLQLIKDKQILYGQVQREYNLKSVYPTYQKYDKLKKQEEIREKALIKATMKVHDKRNLIENINTHKDYLPDVSTEEPSDNSE